MQYSSSLPRAISPAVSVPLQFPIVPLVFHLKHLDPDSLYGCLGYRIDNYQYLTKVLVCKGEMKTC